jgi:nicotinamidase-related amidase
LLPALAHGGEALRRATQLAQAAYAMRMPIWITEQMPEKLGATDAALVQAAGPAARTLAKSRFSAAAALLDAMAPPRPPAPAPQRSAGNARSLPRHLQQRSAAPVPARALEDIELPALVLAGCETHICLLQTALELLEDEIEVWVVTDACASRAERDRDAAFDRLAGAGAELVTTEMVLFEWLRDAKHPQFRLVQALVK